MHEDSSKSKGSKRHVGRKQMSCLATTREGTMEMLAPARKPEEVCLGPIGRKDSSSILIKPASF